MESGKKSIGRRQVIGAALGAGASVATVLGAEIAQRRPRAADGDVYGDVLIIGAGTAGITAAIQAADLGAKVVLLDKNPAVGGEMHASGGTISAAQTKLQMMRMIEDSPEAHYRDAMRLGEFGQDAELLRLAVDNAASMVDWLQELGLEFTADSPEIPTIYRWSAPRTHWPIDNGRGVFRVLYRELKKRVERGDVSISVDTRATKLIKEGGKIVGVAAEHESGKAKTYRARAVILATGGYASNKALMKKYHANSANVLVGALPHTTGDGLIMAQEAGARLANMDTILPAVPGGLEDPENPGRAWGYVLGPPDNDSGAILVNRAGQRFISEDNSSFREQSKALSMQPGVSAFMIFDELIRSKKPPVLAKQAFNPVAVSDELDKQIALGVMVKKASSLSILAREINIDSQRLEQTVTNYNGYVGTGRDLEFGRKASLKIEYPPFYAIRIEGSTLTTVGGVEVNYLSQVVDEKGKAMPGLYAAGEVIGTGKLMGRGIVSGMSFGAALIFGRLVARNAYQYVQQDRAS